MTILPPTLTYKLEPSFTFLTPPTPSPSTFIFSFFNYQQSLSLSLSLSLWAQMAKGGKLTKLKSVLKKWNSFSNKPSRSSSINAVAASSSDDESSSVHHHPVYVGKSRRRYLLSSDVIDHPLFRELVERSRDSDNNNDHDDTINVSCEVVLFEHLLWMLQNADPQPESLDDLVDFYDC